MSVSVYRTRLEPTGLVERDGPTVNRPAAGPNGSTAGTPIVHTVVRGLGALDTALVNTPLRDWQRLADAAPHASMFQSPGWCLPWYRCYQDDYTPFVLVTTAHETLVGVVPMAIEHASGRLLFASDALADYRDIVALAEYRRDVLGGLLQVFVSSGFPDPLQVGWLDPASDTAALLADVCEARGLRFRVRHQPCYRWFPPPPAKPSAQKFLNWYKRQGQVSFEVVDTPEAWAAFRDDYYQQHSLRQIQAGRGRAFDDPRRTAFYDAIFRSDQVRPHVTAFRLDGRLLAGHFGYVWRDVLSLGPPALRLEEEQRSPAVILLAWIIQNAERLGLRGFDLTIGDSDFKKRLGNVCVQLTAVEVFGSRWTWRKHQIRAAFMDRIKRLTARVAGPDAWEDQIKAAMARLSYKAARVREEGFGRAALAAIRAAVGMVVERRRGHIYSISPTDVRGVVPRLQSDEQLEFHENTITDLLLWNGSTLTTASEITICARTYSRCVSAGRTLHTVVLNGRLAGWGYSYYPDGPAQLTETPGATLTFPAGAVSLYDFHVLPEFRGRKIYQALLEHILRLRFAEGAPTAFITVLESNVPSRTAIERIGFKLVAANEYRRVLTRARVRTGAIA